MIVRTTSATKATTLGLFLAAAVTLSLVGCKTNQPTVAPDSGRGLDKQGQIEPADSTGMNRGTMNDPVFDRGVGTTGVGTAGGASR